MDAKFVSDEECSPRLQFTHRLNFKTEGTAQRITVLYGKADPSFRDFDKVKDGPMLSWLVTQLSSTTQIGSFHSTSVHGNDYHLTKTGEWTYELHVLRQRS